MDTKNIILASVLSVGILLLWSIFVEQPVAVDDTIKIQQTESSNIQSDSSLDSLDQLAQTSAVEILSVEDTISDSPRIEINTPGISGSIRLNGLVIDDVVLKAYQETLEADSNNIRYLSP